MERPADVDGLADVDRPADVEGPDLALFWVWLPLDCGLQVLSFHYVTVQHQMHPI